MRAIEIVLLAEKLMKVLSQSDIRMGDWRYIEMYEEYERMLSEGEKKSYIVSVLADRYKLREASVYRVLKRFKRTIKS